MIPYATRTHTKRNLAALRAHGWRLLLTAGGRLEPFVDGEDWEYGLDNGAWPAFLQGRPFDERAFGRAVEQRGPGADWIVAPEIVAGGLSSLDFSVSWLPRLTGVAPILLAVQDGMTVADVEPLLAAGMVQGIFVGGSTDWKLATLPAWAALARKYGVWCHVARVNTTRRIYLCAAAGVTSFDGTSASRFAVTVPALDAARRQTDLEAHLRAQP